MRASLGAALVGTETPRTMQIEERKLRKKNLDIVVFQCRYKIIAFGPQMVTLFVCEERKRNQL